MGDLIPTYGPSPSVPSVFTCNAKQAMPEQTLRDGDERRKQETEAGTNLEVDKSIHGCDGRVTRLVQHGLCGHLGCVVRVHTESL